MARERTYPKQLNAAGSNIIPIPNADVQNNKLVVKIVPVFSGSFTVACVLLTKSSISKIFLLS
ncbi:hypothetical protein EHP00_1377 [Ecytonucleospora hepatopenaei]|uniref:Uncharacterized protein n=1 Tax=Ecytonucleospora hepatopenaei TaxID=646526 RepID=A0A1W0E2Y2_9MICR|nr:hypothetical protein EHP00_1377 [Ecytonucleospora hepatopenaei]